MDFPTELSHVFVESPWRERRQVSNNNNDQPGKAHPREPIIYHITVKVNAKDYRRVENRYSYNEINLPIYPVNEIHPEGTNYRCLQRSSNFPKNGFESPFTEDLGFFRFSVEKEQKVSITQSFQEVQEEECKLLLCPVEPPPTDRIWRMAVNYMCGCCTFKKDWQPFSDCRSEALFDFQQNSPVLVHTHKHGGWSNLREGLASFQKLEIYVTLMSIKHSDYNPVPLEILEFLAKQNCVQTFLQNPPFQLQEGCDIHLKCGDGVVVQAHKDVLSLRSPVFERMLNANRFKEAEEGIVEIEDISSGGMKVLLKFMYTGVLHPNWCEFVEEVVNGAEKYDLGQLKDILDVKLVSICKPENALKLLRLAELHSLNHGKKMLRDFMQNNWIGIVNSSASELTEIDPKSDEMGLFELGKKKCQII